MPPKKKPTKGEPVAIGMTQLENKVDAMNELFMNALNKINELEKRLGDVNTNYTFHTHDIMLRSGPATFNQALYNQWLTEQKARADAAKAEEEGKPKE